MDNPKNLKIFIKNNTFEQNVTINLIGPCIHLGNPQ